VCKTYPWSDASTIRQKLYLFILLLTAFPKSVIYGVAEYQCFLSAVVRTTVFTERKVKVKVTLSRNKSWRLRSGMECWASNLTLTDTTSTAQPSATQAARNLPPRKSLGTHFCYRLSGPQGYRMRPEGIGHLKFSKDPTWNRNGTSRLVAQCFNQLPRSPSLL
jgi:hypothetical protein